MKNVLLFICSILLLILFFTISIIIAIIKIIIRKTSSSYFFECSFAVDVLGNVLGQHIWNFIFIKKNGYKFGRRAETMSSVLGKNQRDKTLTDIGITIVFILDLFQKNHCLISIML